MKFIVLAVLVAAVCAEPPSGYSSGGGAVTASRNFGGSFGGSSGGSGLNEYVDQALLDRVAAVIESGGDGTASGQDNEGAQYVDASIISRVAASLGGSGSSGRVSNGYGAPAAAGGDATLGQPEPAQRIAEWDLSETRQGQSGQASFGSGYEQAAPAPSRSFSSGSSQSSGSVSFGNPEPAQQVAEFEATEQQHQQQQQQQSGGFSGHRGGY